MGVSAIVRAPSPELAAQWLNAALQESGLPGDARAEDMTEWPRKGESVRILQNGEY